MKELYALSDAALLARLDLLDRAEVELHQQAMTAALKAAARDHPAMRDPGSGRLLTAVKEVRDEMRDVETEFLRRGPYAMQEAA
jgi:hypothetical protein